MKKRVLFVSALLAMGSFAFAQAPTNYALDFDGKDDVVTLKNALVNTTNFTIELDVLNKVQNASEDIIFQTNDAASGRFELRIDGGKLSLFIGKFMGSEKVSNYTMPVNKFVHIAIVKDGTMTKVYADGVVVIEAQGTYTLGENVQLGRYFAETVFSFTGQLDELRFWNVAKTADQMKETPKCGLKGDEANLVGYWNFDDGKGTVLTDKSSKLKNGTLANFGFTTNTSNWVTSGTGCVVEQPQTNYALDFDGKDDVVTLKNALVNTTNFTIELDVLNKVQNASEDIIFQTNDAASGRFELRIDGGKLSLFIGKFMGSEKVSNYTMPVNKFVHIAIVKDGTMTKVYADGVVVIEVQGAYTLGENIQLGRYFAETVFSFTGQLDELRFWNVAKTVEQMNATPKCELKGNEANLVGYWNFNDGKGTTLKDMSSNMKNGTLANFALTGDASNWVMSKACEGVITANEVVENSSSIAIYPNPFSSSLNVSNVPANSTIEIYNVMGQLVLSQAINGSVEVSNLTSGTYIVQVKNEGNVIAIQKVVK